MFSVELACIALDKTNCMEHIYVAGILDSITKTPIYLAIKKLVVNAGIGECVLFVFSGERKPARTACVHRGQPSQEWIRLADLKRLHHFIQADNTEIALRYKGSLGNNKKVES